MDANDDESVMSTNDGIATNDNKTDGFLSDRSTGVNTHEYANSNSAMPAIEGRSLREFDEKLCTLRKENFNLKLRIFFLEEKSGGTSNGGAKHSEEDVYKQNIDLKVEIESLREELKKKQDLLCEAAKAMELMGESHKKQQDLNSSTIDDLTQKIDCLQLEMSTVKNFAETSRLTNGNDSKSNSLRLSSHMDAFYTSADDMKTNDDTNKDNLPQNKLSINTSSFRNLSKESPPFESRFDSLQSENGQTTEISDDINKLTAQVHSQKQIIADKLCIIQDLGEKLGAKTKSHEKACKTIQHLLIKTRDLTAEVDEYKSEGKFKDDSETVNSIKAELQHEKEYREELTGFCGLLTCRLKELAGFLDSLLKHKTVLNALAQDHCKEIRKAIDESLDLSMNLTFSSQDRSFRSENAIALRQSISDLLGEKYSITPTLPLRSLPDGVDHHSDEQIDGQEAIVRPSISQVSKAFLTANGHGNRSMYSLKDSGTELEAHLSHKSMQDCNECKISKQKIEQLQDDLDHCRDVNAALEDAIKCLNEQNENLLMKIEDSKRVLAEEKNNSVEMERNLENMQRQFEDQENKNAEKLAKLIENESLKLKHLRSELMEQFEKDIEHELAVQRDTIVQEMVPREDFDNINYHNEELEKHLQDTQNLLEVMRDNENDLHIQLADKDKGIHTLKRSLDDATLQTSKAVLERTKYMNERDAFEKLSADMKVKYDQLLKESSELHTVLAKLGHENAKLHNKLALGEAKSTNQNGRNRNGNDSYSNDESDIENYSSGDTAGESENSSSSQASSQTNLEEFCQSITKLLLDGSEETDQMPNNKSKFEPHDCQKVDAENVELKRKLERTRRTFEKTWNELRMSNQRKQKIEREM